MSNKFDKLIRTRLQGFTSIIDEAGLDAFKKNQIKNNWLESIVLMEYLTRKHTLLYNICNNVTIIGGILIPVVVNLDDKLLHPESAKIIATTLGIFVSVSAGLNQSYRYNERWRHFRLISESLKVEGEMFFSLSGKYTVFNNFTDEAFKLFMTNVKSIKENQIDIYLRKVVRSETNADKHNDESKDEEQKDNEN